MKQLFERAGFWALILGLAVIAYFAVDGISRGAGPREALPDDIMLSAVAHDDTMRISASLALRLASAAGAAVGQGDVWFVVDVDPPHDLQGRAFASKAAATRHLGSLPEPVRGKYRVVGPFNTPPPDSGPGAAEAGRMLLCKEPWTEWCPDTIKKTILERREGQSDDLLRLLFIRDGVPQVVGEWRASEVDALFIGVRAFDRYMAPYLMQVHGLERTMFLRDSIYGPFPQ